MTAIINEYSMSLTEAGVLASTFTLLTIFVGALVGNLMPRIGVKRLICSAMMLSSIGGIVALASTNYEALIIGRALEGIGLIIMMIAGPTAVSMFTDLGSRETYGAMGGVHAAGHRPEFFARPLYYPDRRLAWTMVILNYFLCCKPLWRASFYSKRQATDIILGR